MKNIKKCRKYLSFIAVLSAVLLAFGGGFTTYAASQADTTVPYDTYTYWYGYNGTEKKAVYSRSMYNVKDVITSFDLNGVDNILTLTDSVSYDGCVYVLDCQTPQIIILNEDYTLKSRITEITDGEKAYTFKNASGIFVNDKGIFIADTENKRILLCDVNGSFIRQYELPESELISDDFNYLPKQVSMDNRGYLYVISEGCYEGAVLYDPSGEFLGFYGANTVTAGLKTAVKNIYNKIFMTDAKRGSMQRSLPYQFTDLYIDEQNFVYTTTGNTGKTSAAITQGQIKRMSPGGANILNSDSIDFTDVGIEIENQNIIGVEVNSDGFIFALDSVYGRIFVFDEECNMVTCVGNGHGAGIQDGAFSNPTSICINGDDIIVTDSENRSITVFSLNDYGALVMKAQTLTVGGYYEQAFPLWEGVMAQDNNSQLAYMGMGKGYYEAGNYKKAMEYCEIGCDRETYSLAFVELRDKWLKENLIWIIAAIAVLFVLFSVVKKKFKKKHNLVSDEVKGKLKTYFRIIPHPAESFRTIKEKKNGSYIIAVAMVVLYYVTEVIKTTWGGFAFTYFDPSSYNSVYILVKTSGLIIFFTVAFWCVSTLFGGLGKIGDIFVVTTYSFTPIVFGNLVSTLLTNVLVPDELGFLNIFISIMTIYTVLLLIFGLMIVNDFEFGRFFGVSILAIAFMVVLLFLVVVVVMLLQLLSGFCVTVVSEIFKLFR